MTKTNTLPAVTGCVKKCYREYETEKLGQMTDICIVCNLYLAVNTNTN